MLGRYTFLFDYAHRDPGRGQLADPGAVPPLGLARRRAGGRGGRSPRPGPGPVRLRGAILALGLLIAVCLVVVLSPIVPRGPRGRDGRKGSISTSSPGSGRRFPSRCSATSVDPAGSPRPPRRRDRPIRVGRATWAAILPLLAIADMASAHSQDSPTVILPSGRPPPASVVALQVPIPRSYGVWGADLSSGEPGYASKPVHFMTVREVVAWSLPAVWDLPSTGARPRSSRVGGSRFGDGGPARYDLEGLTPRPQRHPERRSPRPGREGRGRPNLHRNTGPSLASASWAGRPTSRESVGEGGHPASEDGSAAPRLVVEDPDRPLAEDCPSRCPRAGDDRGGDPGACRGRTWMPAATLTSSCPTRSTRLVGDARRPSGPGPSRERGVPGGARPGRLALRAAGRFRGRGFGSLDPFR